MHFSTTVVTDLARVWTRLHRSAAPSHLEGMIQHMQNSGDSDGVANYSRILAEVVAYRSRREMIDDRNTKIGSAAAGPHRANLDPADGDQARRRGPTR
jgi:hypothetical protein